MVEELTQYQSVKLIYVFIYRDPIHQRLVLEITSSEAEDMDITANGSCLMLIKGGTGAKPTFSSYEHLQQLLPNKTVKIDLKRGRKGFIQNLELCIFQSKINFKHESTALVLCDGLMPVNFTIQSLPKQGEEKNYVKSFPTKKGLSFQLVSFLLITFIACRGFFLLRTNLFLHQ